MSQKPNIFLDLDQTLISAYEYNEFDRKKHEKKMKKFNYKIMDKDFFIFERPYLQEFLDYLFKRFNVSIWTAASRDYALFIIDNIILSKPDRKLDLILFYYHCQLSEEYKGHTKDLSMLWDKYEIKRFNKYNTIILDDYDEVYNTQPKNTIVAKPFEFLNKNSSKDKFLLKIIPELESRLKKYKNKKKLI